MKKISIITLSLLAITIMVAVSCKKNNDDLNQQANPVNVKEDYGLQEVTAPNEQYIEKQLRWIARGIPKLAKNNNPFRNEVENRLLNFTDDFFTESHTYFQGWFTTNLSLDYEQEVYDNVNLHFPGGANDYNRDYFETFDFGGIDYYTGLYIPDLDIVDKTKQLVVTVEPWSEDIDESWGYFIDSTTLGLDSILLTEDNEEDYYIWIVYADGGEEIIFPNHQQDGADCDCGNGECQEFVCGETEVNCPDDCPPPTSGLAKLYLLDYALKDDDKRYQESWFNGAYEIWLNFLIIEDQPVSPTYNIVAGTSTTDRTVEGQELDKIPRGDVRRCKRSGNCKGGPSPTFRVHEDVLYSNYDIMNHRIYLLFYERDIRSAFYDRFFFTLGAHELRSTSAKPVYGGNPYTIEPNSSNWQSGTVLGQPRMIYTDDTNPEFRFRLGYIINP